MSRRQSLAPLRDRQFRFFFASRTVNLVGSMMAPIALAFAVLDVEETASALGQVLAARSVPMVVFLLLGLDPHLVPLVLAIAASGAGMEVFGLGWSLAMQENVPEELLSRAYSYDALGSFVAIPVGQLLYGPLGEWFGPAPVLVVSAVAYAGVVLLTLSSRSVRNLEHRVTDEVIPTATPVS